MVETLRNAGLESSNLIVGIDFTKSNQWTGAESFNKRSLHHLGNGLNPYEQAISIIGRTLADFDEDNLIPCFGFGDGKHKTQLSCNMYWFWFPCHKTLMFSMILAYAFPPEVTTHDKDVFSFYPDNRLCNGFEEALTRYREIVPHIHLSGGAS